MYRRKTDYSLYVFATIIVVGFIGYIYSLFNGYDPLACPQGTKTISKPMSFEKYCVEE